MENFDLHFFSTLICFFPRVTAIVILHSAVTFQRYQIYQVLVNTPKVIMA